MYKPTYFLRIILLLVLTKATTVNAQNYSYTGRHSIADYVALDTSKTLLPPSVWSDQVCKLPIGFTFNFGGQNYDSLTVKTSGLLMFDQAGKYNFIFLNKEFTSDVDAANMPGSTIAYELTTTENNQHLLKIEFTNVVLTAPEGTTVHCNFQVRLSQYSNKLEFHMGPIENNTHVTDTYQMGLINMNNTADFDLGFLLQGNAADPAGTHVGPGGKLVSLSNLPAKGTIYTFLPQTN